MSEVIHRGLTVAELAKRYRVSHARVRNWIRRGELAAINRRDAGCSRPSWIVMPEALADFERGRMAATPESSKPQRRRRRNSVEIDFYPG